MLVWENILPCEVRGGTLEYLDLELEPALIAAELSKLSLFLARQLRHAAVLVDLGLGHPVPQARLGDTQILRQLGDGFGPFTGQLDSTTTELRRVGNRHDGILPCGRSHLRSGVRAPGGSSLLPAFEDDELLPLGRR